MRAANSSEPVALCANVAFVPQAATHSITNNVRSVLCMNAIVAECSQALGNNGGPLFYLISGANRQLRNSRNDLGMDSKKAKHRFNRNPSCHRVLTCIACRLEFPAANRLCCAFLQSEPDAPTYSNVRRPAVSPH